MSQAVHERSAHRARTEAAALQTVVERLTSQFPELPPEAITQAVRGEYDEYQHSKIRDYVPILVERSVRGELRNTATQGHRA